MTSPQSSEGDERVSQAGGNLAGRERGGEGHNVRRRKRWYEKTSVTLCVAAALAAVGLGFIHVIVGVTSSYGLPFDLALRESFGYHEMVIDPERIQALPYSAAKLKYPLSLEVLQRTGYLPDGPGFEARMMARQQENISQWQRQFEATLGQPRASWQDQLRGTGQVSADPEDAEACNQRGVVCARQGEYQAAIAEFTRAIRRDPTCADAFYNRALVSIEIGSIGQGASDLGTVLSIRPGFVEGHVHRGRLYVAMNEPDKALADFTRAIELDPKCVEALFHRSLVHYIRGDAQTALDDVHRIEGLGMALPAGLLRALRGERDDRVSARNPKEQLEH
ncbi:MAG: tetratricopeptide repeat protein [Phycisphaerales bacterium]